MQFLIFYASNLSTERIQLFFLLSALLIAIGFLFMIYTNVKVKVHINKKNKNKYILDEFNY